MWVKYGYVVSTYLLFKTHFLQQAVDGLILRLLSKFQNIEGKKLETVIKTRIQSCVFYSCILCFYTHKREMNRRGKWAKNGDQGKERVGGGGVREVNVMDIAFSWLGSAVLLFQLNPYPLLRPFWAKSKKEHSHEVWDWTAHFVYSPFTEIIPFLG